MSLSGKELCKFRMKIWDSPTYGSHDLGAGFANAMAHLGVNAMRLRSSTLLLDEYFAEQAGFCIRCMEGASARRLSQNAQVAHRG
jgi:hypothetical protein